ncbi:unnamed protein product [Callosobruchus maculatus]|uniref:Uncharacterized protein n=1 Tax=Callosobruchus maculatus TaxID=64391 RepID=A0A653CBM7_CALMS|nr:unnamed protein product [Callosobruchus maculatus]
MPSDWVGATIFRRRAWSRRVSVNSAHAKPNAPGVEWTGLRIQSDGAWCVPEHLGMKAQGSLHAACVARNLLLCRSCDRDRQNCSSHVTPHSTHQA